jgi:peptide-methionine (R)-S-oxide reductase
MNRRTFIGGTLTGAGAAFGALVLWPLRCAHAENTIKEITMSDAEWKKKLEPQAYDVLRCEGTERAFTSPLLEEHRKGVFKCAGCGLALFTSDKKFDSGTGWPSFFDVIPGHVKTKEDRKLFMARTEYHCAQCGGHQGHVFPDGPKPTGLRYCNNGVALTFEVAEEKKG